MNNAATIRKVRRRLWEIPRSYHCAVIGTCLSLEAAHQILRKTKVAGLEGSTEYQLHCAAVELAQQAGVVSRLLDKALERTHKKTWAVYRRLKTAEAVAEQWQQDVQSGNLSGGFWAVMHHPASSNELIEASFGTIHMLSHHVGGGCRARLQRHDAIAAQVDKLRDELRALGEEQQAERRRAEAQLAEREAQLEEQRERTKHWQRRAMAADPERVAALEDERDHRIRFIAKQDRQLIHCQQRIERLEKALNDAERTIAELRASKGPQTAAEGKEAQLPSIATSSALNLCPSCDLQGGTILYVGGEKRLVPRLKQLTEAANGHLLHHDGGIEDSIRILPQLCARADLIFCPVSKVGHTAVHHVKKTCIDSRKRFIPLRRASLRAFSAGLHQAADDRGGAPLVATHNHL